MWKLHQKKILQNSQFQRLEDVGCRSRHGTQGHPKWSRSPEQVRITDRIPTWLPIWIPLIICWMAKFLLNRSICKWTLFHCLLRPTAETGKDMPLQAIAVTCRWSSAGAQLQWLNASLSGVTDEHLLLKSHLQDVFSGRLPGCRCCFSTYRSVVTWRNALDVSGDYYIISSFDCFTNFRAFLTIYNLEPASFQDVAIPR